MSEPMVSYDNVGFYLLSKEVAQARQGGAVRPGRRRGVRRLSLVSADDRPRTIRSAIMPPTSSTATTTNMRDHVAGLCGRRPCARFRSRTVRCAPEPTMPWTRRCASTSTVMLVDDPVKRVDNMTMAWGLEARVPFLDHELVELAARVPAREKLRDGGKGILKDIGRTTHPLRGHRPAEGLFPRAGTEIYRGPVLDFVRDALDRKGARRPGPGPPRAISTRCSPRPRNTSRACGVQSCGRSPCSNSGCNPTASEALPDADETSGRDRRSRPMLSLKSWGEPPEHEIVPECVIDGLRLGAASVRPDLRRVRRRSRRR